MSKPEKFVHPSALGPTLTVSELFLFCDVCKLMRDGLQLPKIAEQIFTNINTNNNNCDKDKELKAFHKRCRRTLDKVAKALFGPKGNRDLLELTTLGSQGDSFYQRLTLVLATLRKPEEQPSARENCVVIHGSDFCVLWILPAALEESKILANDIELEIKRGSFRKYMSHLRDGTTDLAIGPKAPDFDEFESERILSVPRVLIYPEGHTFACKKLVSQVTLDDLKDETFFFLGSEAVPDVRMSSYFKHLPRKRVVVDSISHIYQYVARGLGVSLGYDPVLVPLSSHPGVSSFRLQGEDARKVKPAEFFVYYTKSHLPSRSAQMVLRAIRGWATKKMHEIDQAAEATK